MQSLVESESLTICQLLARDIQAYFLCELITELLVYFMLVFSPWAFGTTETWSIWTMNVCGYCLGLLLLLKVILRKRRTARLGYCYEGEASVQASRMTPVLFTRILVLLTLLILAYCLVSAVNRRAKFNPVTMTFEYFDCLRWLPHSLESESGWRAFWTYLALACSFWAVRDWLTGKRNEFPRRQRSPLALPIRVQRLLILLVISGGLLAVEGIVQRLANSPKLLFLVIPEIHQNAIEQFASYAYRANAAQYFNLLWPVCLGFWWTLCRFRPASLGLILMGCVVTMAACPMISSSRGATLVDLAMMVAAGFVLLSDSFKNVRSAQSKLRSVLVTMLFAGLVLALGSVIGWKRMWLRAGELSRDLEHRNEIYERGRLIARDYPLFGTGPGTFERIYQLYRRTPDAYWPAQLHNDWLETRITFGWIGSGLIALAFLTILLRWFGSGSFQCLSRFVLLVWISLAGCLVQARWDFPLQVYSIVFLFLVWCALLSTISLEA